MSNWATLELSANRAMKRTFGVSILYASNLSTSYLVTMVQADPARMEIEQPEVRVVLWGEAGDFLSYPARGDQFAFGAATQSYRVYDVREADANGAIWIYGEKVV